MKYLIRSVKREVEAIGIWTEDNWDMKRLNSLYIMICVRFKSRINKGIDSLSWSSVAKYLYTRKGYTILQLNEKQE